MWLKAYLDISPARPRWAFIADALIARAILASERRVEPVARINTFLQTWEANTTSPSGLPKDLSRMIRVAKRSGTRIDSQSPSGKLAAALPVWYHFALTHTRGAANSKSAKCLRHNHEVITVADCLAVERKPTGTDVHLERACCKCMQCEHDRTNLGCDNPARCARAAAQMLARLQEKWRPTIETRNDGLSLNRTQKHENQVNAEDRNTLTFDPSVTQDVPVGEAFRVFAGNENGAKQRARRPARQFQLEHEAVEVYTDGSCNGNGTAAAVAGAGVWFGPDDARNISERVPGECRSNQAGEAYACLLATEAVPNFAPMTIVTD
ncbi:hypothetical protein C2E23DRAFT_706454, partial [Lenzites betulinus]